MTNTLFIRQFEALHARIEAAHDLASLVDNPVFRGFGPESRAATPAVIHLLQNAWSAEYALRCSPPIHETHIDARMLAWTFPQAYYSILFSTRALMALQDIKTAVPQSVGRYVSGFVARGFYPPSLLFYSYSSKSGWTSLFGSCLDDALSMALLLRREIQQQQHDEQKKTKHLSPTTFFNLIEQLQITSANANTEAMRFTSLTADEAVRMHTVLVDIVSHVNAVHEAYIARILGLPAYHDIVQARPAYLRESFLIERYENMIYIQQHMTSHETKTNVV